MLRSLFFIRLSGTHATPEQRLKIIRKLIESNTEEKIELGIHLLGASLETMHFSSPYGFEFGARARDYGFLPRNIQEAQQWFKLFIEYTVTLAVSDFPFAPKVKALLADNFRGLWIKAEMLDELESAARKISSKSDWIEGWVAIRTTKKFNSKDMKPDLLSRLNSLDHVLKPKTLVEKVKLYAIAPNVNKLELIDTLKNKEEKASECLHRLESFIRSLGREVGKNKETFKELLPYILSNDNTRSFSFGKGLADGTTNLKKMWQDLHGQLSHIEESKRNYQVFRGFLNAISKIDTNRYEEFLDESVTDKDLAIIYPWLQTSAEINIKGVERLKRSLEFGAAPIWQYLNLAYRRAHETISDDNLCELLKLISSQDEGVVVSLEILHMRIHGCSVDDAISDIIACLGQELLLSYKFLRKNKRATPTDYALANIIKACFVGSTAEENARVLCRRLAESFVYYDVFCSDYNHVLKALAIVQPLVFLDVFLGDDFELNHRIKQAFIKEDELGSAISYIDEDFIIDWCERNPGTRYRVTASSIMPFQNNKNDALEWTPLALRIINNSSDPYIILNEFKSTFRPLSWSGSRADIMQSRLNLISELKSHENSLIADCASKVERTFQEEIRSEREWELKRESELNDRFE